jgi:hypothetical protein
MFLICLLSFISLRNPWVVGAACYLVDLLWVFLLPDFGKEIHGFISIPSIIAEVSMVLYLLVIGVKTQKPDERILAAE